MIARLALSLVLAASTFPSGALAALPAAPAAPAGPEWARRDHEGRFWKSVKFKDGEQERELWYRNDEFRRSGRTALYKLTHKENQPRLTVYDAEATPYSLTIAESRLKVVKEGGFSVNAVPGETLNHDISRRQNASVPRIVSIRLAGAPAPTQPAPAAADAGLGGSERKWLSFKEKAAYESERAAAGDDAGKKKAADDKARGLVKRNIRADKKAGYEALLGGTPDAARIEAYLKDIPLYSGGEIELSAEEMGRLRQEHAAVVQQWEREALAPEDAIGRWQRAKEGRRLLATPPARPTGPQVTRPDGPTPGPVPPAGTANQPQPPAGPATRPARLTDEQIRAIATPELRESYVQGWERVSNSPPCKNNPPAPPNVDPSRYQAEKEAACADALRQLNDQFQPADAELCAKAFRDNTLRALPAGKITQCCGSVRAANTGAPAAPGDDATARRAMQQVRNLENCGDDAECAKRRVDGPVGVNLAGPQIRANDGTRTGAQTREAQMCREALANLPGAQGPPGPDSPNGPPAPTVNRGRPGDDKCVKDAKGDCKPEAKDKNEWLPVMQGALIGAPIGALVGAFFPPWGIVIGAAIGFSAMWGLGKYNLR